MAVNMAAAPPGVRRRPGAIDLSAADPPPPGRPRPPAGRFGPPDLIGHTPVDVPGSAEPLDLRAQDPEGGFGRPPARPAGGPFPTAPGEVALTAARRRAAVQSATGPTRRPSSTVVGKVENPAIWTTTSPWSRRAVHRPRVTVLSGRTTAQIGPLRTRPDGQQPPPGRC